MIKSKIVLLSALVSCTLISGCKEENKNNVSIEFMHSSVEQERQAVISKLIARFEKENPGITVKQVPVEEDAYNTKVITLSRSGSLPEVIETSHDYAKVMDKEQLIDRQAVATVISNVGEGAFYDGVLRIVRTEDGSAWTGVPVSAWIGGIWYRKDVLAKAGLEEPKNWQQLLDVAQKLNDPANKKYGIALPTAESVLTEQSFSQFALSNQANVFNAEGKITLDTPEMMQALTYYRNLAANTMPGSNDIMEVKDAFMNGTAPMAIYSTYILPAVIKEGDPKNVGLGEGSALPVGVPVPWPSATPPTGWLKCNGAAFSAEEYPELAKVYPTNKLPDLRGEFIRGWDDGRGVDAGRQLLSSQGDAIRNIEGFADGGIGMSFDAIRGAFYDAGTRSARMPNNTTDIGKTDDLGFDASRVVPTANENRPRNIAFNYIVRAA
ncbi:TPA: ABC transporter substrate-binding protein [Escherichia coli]